MDFCSIEEGIPMAILLSFASEGNNDGDGMNLAKYANQWIQMVCLDFGFHENLNIIYFFIYKKSFF